MNAMAHETELKLITDEHNKRLHRMREALLDDILTEVRCLNKKGYTITVGLLSSFLSIYVHEGEEIVKDFTADYDNAGELISVLEQLEKLGAPKKAVPDVENDIYDLEEETPDAETV